MFFYFQWEPNQVSYYPYITIYNVPFIHSSTTPELVVYQPGFLLHLMTLLSCYCSVLNLGSLDLRYLLHVRCLDLSFRFILCNGRCGLCQGSSRSIPVTILLVLEVTPFSWCCVVVPRTLEWFGVVVQMDIRFVVISLILEYLEQHFFTS